MKPFARRWILVFALLVSAVASAAFAAGTMHTGHRGNWFGQALDKLHGELKLNAAQEALWQSARTQTRQAMEQMREEHRKVHASIQQRLSAPQADLRAIASEMDAAHARHGNLRRQIREQWLAVYDSLDAGQRETVRQFLLERMEHRRHGHHHRHHGGQQSETPVR